MSGFKSPLQVQPHPDGVMWELLKPFVYECQDGHIIIVPAGFVTDFASIPREFWSLLPVWGIYGFAAVIHDFLYSTQTLPKERADAIFLEAMKVSGVSAWERDAIYTAVREFGQHAWAGHTEELQEAETTI